MGTKTPADNHRPTGSGEGRNGVLIMEVGCSAEPDWALSPKQAKPACQHDLSLDSSLTTTPRPFSSLNMLTRSSQEKPQTICRSSPGQTHREEVYSVLMAEEPLRFSRIMESVVMAERR
ncbi:hypothetical protein EYF80_026502 [Liparis tanakae]|uniref:Uncharacterized protein n=1 Tax=Liparis tanakae TaxID=230148 RepID=A0A4Z2HC98_9TELE|nr:hypothetical protein EYF80_026502 [Liparis tanakae]